MKADIALRVPLNSGWLTTAAEYFFEQLAVVNTTFRLRDVFLLQPLLSLSFAEPNYDDIVKSRKTKCCVILAQAGIH